MADKKKKEGIRDQLDKLYDARHIAEQERRNATDDAQRRTAETRVKDFDTQINELIGEKGEE